MQNNLGSKLIAVLDVKILKLYQAKGLKIIKEISKNRVHSEINHRLEGHENVFKKGSTPSSQFEPHTVPKDIEQQESSKAAIHFIEMELQNNPEYNELIIVSEPNMLGFINHEVNNKLKNIIKLRKIIVKEIKKDLVNHDSIAIEKAVFA